MITSTLNCSLKIYALCVAKILIFMIFVLTVYDWVLYFFLFNSAPII